MQELETTVIYYINNLSATIKTVSSGIIRFDGTDRLASANYSAH